MYYVQPLTKRVLPFFCLWILLVTGILVVTVGDVGVEGLTVAANEDEKEHQTVNIDKQSTANM